MRNATREEIVQEFHEAFGHPVGEGLPQNLNTDPMTTKAREILSLRKALLEEELGEVCRADTKERLLKELADLQHVLSGFAVTFGLPLDEAFRRVHESNMSKLGEDGKVLKGPNYQPPDLSDLV